MDENKSKDIKDKKVNDLEVKDYPSEKDLEKIEKKKSKRKNLILLIIIFTLILLILCSGITIGFIGYPKIINWLEDHNFIEEQDEVVNNETNEGTTNKLQDLLDWSKGSQKDEENEKQLNSIVEVISDSKDSVVSIAVTQDNGYGGTEVVNNIGSGFVVDPSGLIVTNQHVVSDLNVEYKVVTTDGKEFVVKEIYRDDFNDIALLKIEAENLKALSLGDSDLLMQGETVIAIGTPLGQYAGSVTVGVVSGLNRSVTATQGGFWGVTKNYENVIQTDAAINPGNSGGPLLNEEGEVIGVNFATTGGASNISFALPINIVKYRLEEYRKYGKFLKPVIGIQYDIVTEADAAFYKNLVQGAYVQKVIPGLPAEQAGIKKGDIVVQFGDDKVTTSLASLIQKHKIGDEVKVKVWRAGEELEFTLKLAEAE